MGRVANLFGLGGGKGDTDTLMKMSDTRLQQTFGNVRGALANYATFNNDSIPDRSAIYDWPSLRRVVNAHGAKSLPATQEEAGFRFVRYDADVGVGDYTLLVELLQAADGIKRLEVTPYGLERVN